jgi:hypothetical protein
MRLSRLTSTCSYGWQHVTGDRSLGARSLNFGAPALPKRIRWAPNLLAGPARTPFLSNQNSLKEDYAPASTVSGQATHSRTTGGMVDGSAEKVLVVAVLNKTLHASEAGTAGHSGKSKSHGNHQAWISPHRAALNIPPSIYSFIS